MYTYLPDILAGKYTFDDFAVEVDEHGNLELTGDGNEVIEATLLLREPVQRRADCQAFGGQLVGESCVSKEQ